MKRLSPAASRSPRSAPHGACLRVRDGILGGVSGPARRKTVSVDVGGVAVGNGRPIVVQAMTNTDTADVDGAVALARAPHAAGIVVGRGRRYDEAVAREG